MVGRHQTQYVALRTSISLVGFDNGVGDEVTLSRYREKALDVICCIANVK